MSESKKLLIGFAIIGVLCLCVAVAGVVSFREFGNRAKKLVSGDPTSVAQVQDNIAEFDIPSGYKASAMNMFVYDIIMLTPDSTSKRAPTIMLMQYNGIISGNSAQVEQQLRQAAEQQSGQSGTPMQIVDSFDKEIRGETVTVTVSEGKYESITTRQWMTVFKGNRGPTILMIQGIVKYWDDQIIEDFIESIK